MKFFLEYIFVASLFLTGCRDSGEDEALYKLIGGSFSEKGQKICANLDGTFVILGTIKDTSSTGSDIIIIKIRKDGKIIWQKRFGNQEENVASDIVRLNDSGYLILASTNYHDIFLLRIDSEGDTLWTKELNFEGTQIGFEMSMTADGNFIICGESIPESGGVADGYFLLVNSIGDTLWTKTLRKGHPFILSDVETTNDNGFIFVGSNYQNFEDGVIMKTDGEGNILWENSYDYGAFESYYCIRKYQSGKYLVLGERFGYTDSTSILIKEIDESHIISYSINLDFPYRHYASSIDAIDDTTFVIVGSTLQRGNYDCYVSMYLRSGNKAGSHIFGNSGSDSGSDFSYANDQVSVIGTVNFTDYTSMDGDILYFILSLDSIRHQQDAVTIIK